VERQERLAAVPLVALRARRETPTVGAGTDLAADAIWSAVTSAWNCLEIDSAIVSIFSMSPRLNAM